MKKIFFGIICFLITINIFGQAVDGQDVHSGIFDNISYRSAIPLTNDLQVVYLGAMNDAIAPGQAKEECDAATTTNITRSGASQTIDGFAAVAGTRILVKDQTTASENGVFVVASGSWTRATDMDSWSEIYHSSVFILNGTDNSGATYTSSMASTGTLNSDVISWNKSAQIVLPDLTAYDINNFSTARKKIFVTQGSTTDSTDAIFTTGALTETVTGLEFSGSGVMVDGTKTLAVTSGYTIPTTTQITNAGTAYNDKINSLAFSGTTTKTLTLTQQDGGTVSGSFSDLTTESDPIYAADSSFLKTGVRSWNSSIAKNIDASDTTRWSSDNSTINEIQTLSYTGSTGVLSISSSNNITVPLATTSVRGLMSSVDKLELDSIQLSDAAYSSGWNNSLKLPTQNALYDILNTLSTVGGYNTSVTWNSSTNVLSVLDGGGTKSDTITGFLESEVDGSITNEGSLSVGVGDVNSSIINSNTSGSSSVTLLGTSDISITESGNSITVDAVGLEPSISKGTGFAKYSTGTGLWSWDNSTYSVSTHTHSEYMPYTGGTFSGKVTFPVSSSSAASLRIPSGFAPTSASQGDVYTDASGVYVYLAGTGWVNLYSSAGSYVLPIATSSVLGGVKVGSLVGLSMTGAGLDNLELNVNNLNSVSPATGDYVAIYDISGSLMKKSTLGDILALIGGGMVYPGSGIPLSTGSSWGTSITNNSTNWNTAYSWGNHAGLYTPLAHKTTEDALNGLVKVNGAGSYSAVTDNSSNWNSAYSWGNHSGLYTPIAHKTTEDAINGIIKCNGSGTYSALTDNSSNWNLGYTWRLTTVNPTLPITATLSSNTLFVGINAATTSAAGSMSAADKLKLNGIAYGATNYTHPTGDGNLHVSATSTTSNGKVLTAGATAGSFGWQSIPSSMVYPAAGIAVSTGSAWGTSITDASSYWNTAYTYRLTSASGTAPLTLTLSANQLTGSVATVTTSADGLMTSADKVKLNGIANYANNYTHPSGDGYLHVPVTGTTSLGKVLTAGATAGFLTWETPPTANSTTNGYLSSSNWTTFNNKQAALVSGTNIKTINGSSILGSGDLTITGGGVGTSSNSELLYNNSGNVDGTEFVKISNGNILIGSEDEFATFTNTGGTNNSVIYYSGKGWTNSQNNYASGFSYAENYDLNTYNSLSTQFQTRMGVNGYGNIMVGELTLNVYDVTTDHYQIVTYHIYVNAKNLSTNTSGSFSLVSRSGSSQLNLASISSITFNASSQQFTIDYSNCYESIYDRVLVGINIKGNLMSSIY